MKLEIFIILKPGKKVVPVLATKAYTCRHVEFYLFLTLTLDEVSGQHQAIATLPHERTPVPTE